MTGHPHPMSDFDWPVEQSEQWQAGRPPHPSKRDRRWMRRLLIVLIGVMIAATLFAYLIGQNDPEKDTIEQDILAGYQLIRDAAEQSDIDLFLLFLSHEDAGWYWAQRDVFNNNVLFERSAIGLPLQAAEPRIVDITLSPERDAAQVITEFAYAQPLGYGTTQTIKLKQIAFFRFNNGRWEYAAPDKEFWGDNLTYTGQILTTSYPERDKAIVTRLARDLDHMFNEFCIDTLVDACRNALTRELDLSTNPLTLPTITEAFEPAFSAAAALVLPAPTLIGVPDDEAGYQALLRGYALQLYKQFSRNMYGQQLISSSAFNSYFYRLPLLKQRAIDLGIRPWPVNNVVSPPTTVSFAQDVLFLCHDLHAESADVLRYDINANRWSTELAERKFLYMSTSPEEPGVILAEYVASKDGSSTFHQIRWANGREIDIEDNLNLDGRYERLSPDGAHMLILTYNENGSADLSLGNAAGEPLKKIGPSDRAYWWNDQTYVYIVGDEIYVASVTGDTPERLITLQDLRLLLPESGVFDQIFISSAQPILDGSNRLLVEAIGSEDSRSMKYAFIFDGNSGQLSSIFRSDTTYALASISPEQQWITIPDYDSVHAIWRWQLYKLAEDRTLEYNFPNPYIFPGNEPYQALWSEDDRWVLLLLDGVATVVNPVHDVQFTIVPETPLCTSAAWVDRDT